MSISILPGTTETFKQMKGQVVVPHEGEGIVFIKVVFLKPETICDGDPAQTVDNAQGVVLFGSVKEIKEKINEWLDQSSQSYKEKA